MVCHMELLEVVLSGGGDTVVVAVMRGKGFLRMFSLMFLWWLSGCYGWVVMAYWRVGDGFGFSVGVYVVC